MNKREYLDMMMSEHTFKTFDKSQRSSFSYWFNHWKSFNLCAYYLGIWKFKYLFHDIEKPWIKLFFDYPTVQKWHRKNNSHHQEYKKGLNKIDWYGLIIDNECSRFTKKSTKLNSREYIENILDSNEPQYIKDAYTKYAIPILNRLKL